MLSGPLFDKLDYIARQIRKNEQPFGGIQLVLAGDFLQVIHNIHNIHTYTYPWYISVAYVPIMYEYMYGDTICMII